MLLRGCFHHLPVIHVQGLVDAASESLNCICLSHNSDSISNGERHARICWALSSHPCQQLMLILTLPHIRWPDSVCRARQHLPRTGLTHPSAFPRSERGQFILGAVTDVTGTHTGLENVRRERLRCHRSIIAVSRHANLQLECHGNCQSLFSGGKIVSHGRKADIEWCHRCYNRR